MLEVVGLAKGAFTRARQLAGTGVGASEVVVLQRKLLPVWQVHLLRRTARRLVFDFDDAVMYRDSYDPRGPLSARRARRFAATVRAADEVTAGNDFLADLALRAGAKPERVRVIPTCVDVDKYRPAPALGHDRRDTLDLVWIGSSSTLQGLERQRALWDGLARAVPGVRMRVICDRFPVLGAMPVVPVPWSEATEAAELSASDVGVTWVPDDLWSRGKCGLKVLQYQAAGLPVLANPVGVHGEMVRPGVSGSLPDSAEEWARAVGELKADPALRRRMGNAARGSAVSGYSVDAWQETVVAAMLGSPYPGRAMPRGRAPSLAGAGRFPVEAGQ